MARQHSVVRVQGNAGLSWWKQVGIGLVVATTGCGARSGLDGPVGISARIADASGEAAVESPLDASADEGTDDAGPEDARSEDAGRDGEGMDASVDAQMPPPLDASLEAEAGDAAPVPPLGSCNGVSLLTNCSFELPLTPPTGLGIFSNDQPIDGWVVVGVTGNVNTVATTFTQNGFLFLAEDGEQSMDVTGFTDTFTGVAQTVTTEVGASYELTFWVGNIVDPEGIFGVTSTIQVQIDGATAYSATNSNGAGTTTLAWEEFSFSFAATSDATVIAFMNGDPPDDTSNFVDNVTLVPLL